MMIDTDDFINFQELKIKIVYKNGKVFETKMDSKNIKSIDFSFKHKEYRKGIWDNTETEGFRNEK